MAAPDYFARKPSYNRSRSGLGAPGATTPASPHTPLLTRSLSSQLTSPGASYRAEEDTLVYELGSRSFRAGFAGDSAPRCIIPFGPDQLRRLNDFTTTSTTQRSENDWAKDWELWDLDIRDMNLGLIEDKIERAIRNAHTNYLMLDQRPRKVFLVLPSALPHPLVSLTLNVVFNAFQPATVQLWTPPLLCAVSAGLRSALIVDIGWHETTITALYEYREVLHRRSSRAGKLLTRNMADTLRKRIPTSDPLSFDTAEDVVTRMAWCRSSHDQQFGNNVALPLGASSAQVPFDRLADPAEETFFSTPVPLEQIDDHDLPIHLLAYKCLLSLPLDVRAICVSRILITGGVSEIPGLKSRLLREIENIVNAKGWDPVMNYGSATEKRQKSAQQQTMTLPTRTKQPDANGEVAAPADEQPLARNAPQERDEVAEKLQREVQKRGVTIQGEVRGVQTLGAWAGASLVASLKVDAAFEVKRDDFFKNGLGSLGHAF
ncbi:fungal-specific actin related protein, partial [Aureobasidium melanogenum]|uniref:Fungal-specific actin related protein n=1 Tax=Aureobasidium melanogenum (strain CBS 110374) TaxID=1043003 RepID=A0A074VP10_AURM1